VGFVGSLYSHNLLILLVPSIGLSICTHFSSFTETPEYGLDIGDNRFITWVTIPYASVVASASIPSKLFPSGILPPSVSANFPVLLRGAISVSRLFVLMLVRLLILPRLALVVCSKTE
jgi:hypothetical protein